VRTIDCGHQIAMASPAPGEAGMTADWRTERPVLEAGLCLASQQGKESCQLCWVYCPDVCIARGVPPVVNFTYCKGCGICAEVCPTDAIRMVPDAREAAAPPAVQP